MKLAALLLWALCLSSLSLKAQTAHVISGVVKDSSGAVIEAATVKIETPKDTISSTTNKKGQFRLENIKTLGFTLVISSAGFEIFTARYVFQKDQSSLEVNNIILKVKVHELQEVVVKSVIVPITIKEDTIEYDARAYHVRTGDLVDELLKQLPGVEVDKDGNVKSDGKEMTKLRVNGQDFFTSDVKTFIKQLPASIISKLQVIEDYGDEATFTGIKKGEPEKLLNLVTKPGMNKGTFSNAALSAGSHNVQTVSANANIWRDKQQISINGSLSHADKRSLVNNSNNASASYSDHWGKKLSFNANYNYNNMRSKSNSSTYNETFYPSGSLFTNTDHASEYSSKGHNLHLALNYNKDKSNYFTFQGNIGYNSSVNSTTMKSSQKGLVFQDLQNNSSSTQSTPNFSGSGFYSHRFKKAGRVVSVSFNLRKSTNNSNQRLFDHTQYYESNTGAYLKDSVLERIVQSGNNSTNTGVTITYSEPINKNNYFDFSYNYNSNLSNRTLITTAAKLPGKYEFVDSLSNTYQNMFNNKAFAFNYRHTAKMLNYTAGLQVQPNTILGEYVGHTEGIHHSSINFSPVAGVRATLSKTASVNINYSGQSTSPDITELQPVRDSRNLQNIIIGNPDLRSQFHHNLSLSYHKALGKKGAMYTMSANGSTIKNQIVSDLHLINDTTIGSFKQETHFKNVNGNYNVGGSYSLTQPFLDRKLNIDYSGRVTFSRTISYADNVLNIGNNTHLSQSLRFRVNSKWLWVNGGAQYGHYINNYVMGLNRNLSAETWNYNLSANISIRSKLNVGIEGSKQISNGYYQSLANNPLYLNANATFSFLKKEAATLNIQVNDILNQGNFPLRMVSANSITDSRTLTVTRYVLLTLNIRLNKFGGME